MEPLLLALLLFVLPHSVVRSQDSTATHIIYAENDDSLPRQFECYSCMSLQYQTSWKFLQHIYVYPKVFTDRCRDPQQERGMPTALCSTGCVSLVEPDVEAGVFIGYKHIRGCLDRVLRHGFNSTALRNHRLHGHHHPHSDGVQLCRLLPRASLFNPAKGVDFSAVGDVKLCVCAGDRCNSARSSAPRVPFLLLVAPLFLALFHRPPRLLSPLLTLT